MILEQDGPGDEFHGFFAAAAERPLEARFQVGAPIAVPGRVKYVERNPAQEVRLVGVAFTDVEEALWEALRNAVAARDEHAPRIRRSG